MAKGALRQAIETAVNQSFTPAGGAGWWSRVLKRWLEYSELFARYAKISPTPSVLAFPGQFTAHIIYALTGSEMAIAPLRSAVGNQGVPDVSQLVASIFGKMTSSPVVREIAEAYGALYTEPILRILESYAGKETADPKEFFRAIHGIGAEFTAAAGLADLLLETATGGQVEAFGQIADSMLRTMGVGWTAQGALQPILTYGIDPGLNAYYKKLYRPYRFAISDLRDLYALGKIDQENLREQARIQGVREQDIDLWVALAFRQINESQIWNAWQKGFISQDETARRLRGLGYDPADIPLLFQLNPKADIEQDKTLSAGTARQAYREHLISGAELRALLEGLHYSAQEIDLIVAIEDAKGKADLKSLSTSQVKNAWVENVLTDQEARHWLAVDGLGDEQIDLLLATWKAEIIPPYRKLNVGTIIGAYVEGVIVRGTAKTKLTSVGLTDDDAELELKLAESRNPQAFGAIGAASGRRLSPSVLADLVALQLITPAQMASRLAAAGYSAEDAALLSEAARLRAQPQERKLGQGSILSAYLAGVIDRARAGELLGGIGLSAEASAILLDTLEKENPGLFGGTQETRARQLSPSALEDLYLNDVIDVEQYGNYLAGLGFADADVILQIQRADQIKAPGQRIVTQSSIERAYLAGVFDRTTAFNKLVALDFDPADAEAILQTVEAENPAAFTPDLVQSSRLPSITVLVAALQNGVITEDEYFARAQEIGFSPADAQLYLSVSVTNERKGVKELSPSQIVNAYGKGLLGRGIALARLTGSGYSNDDAILLLRMEKESVTLTDTWDALLAGSLGPFDAIAALVSSRYSDQDIYDAFAGLGASMLASMGLDLAQLQATLAAIPGGE